MMMKLKVLSLVQFLLKAKGKNSRAQIYPSRSGVNFCLAKNGRENQLSLLASHAFWGLIQCDDVLEESSGRLLDTLKALWEKKDTIDHVLTNLHELGPKVTNFLDQLKKKNLNISYMTPGDRIPEWKGEELDISAYVLDIARMEEMKNLFPSAVANEQQVGANQEEFAVANEQQLGANQEEYAFANELQVGANQEENSTRMGVVSKNHDSEPSLENKADEQNEEASGDDSSPVERKPRVVWTKEMHRKFLEAIEILGPDNSFPKKIVELMNEPGLTRENVASHLQKYRMCLRKNQEEAANANSGRNPFFPLSEYSLQRYYHLNRESYSFNFQQAGSSSGIISTPPYLGMSNPFAPGSSTGISILKPTNLHQQQQSSLIKMQPYVNRHPMTSSSFRIYGDETRSMLLTTTDDHGSSSSNNSVSTTLNSQNFNSFIGLRFTGNGNLEFGQTSIISGNNEIEKTSTLSSASGTEILDQSYPLTPASYAPKPPNNEVNYDQLPSIFGDWTSEEDQAILALLTTPMEAETVTCEENVPDRTSLVIESNDREQFLPSGVPSFALGGTSGNGISVQESSSVSANEAAGCSLSPDMFWKHVYDDADIRHFH